MTTKQSFFTGLGIAIAVMALCAGTSNYKHRMVVQDGAAPTCTVATGDGDICVEDAVEIQGNLAVTGTHTQTGAVTWAGTITAEAAATFESTVLAEGILTCTAGAGAITFDAGDETIVLFDNDSTALDIGAAGATDMLRFDTTNASEGVTVGGYLTASGVLTCTAGAGAITFDAGDETIVLFDNDATSLDIGAAGATDMLRFDTTDASEGIIVGGYLNMQTNPLAAMLSEIRFCGQGSNGSTANYVGPVWPADMDTDMTYGAAGCDGKDHTTETTADLVWSIGLDYKPVALMCSIDDGGTDDTLVFQLRDDAADVTGMTCSTVLDGAGFNLCTVQDATPATIAAGSAIAVEIVATDDDCSGCDMECRLFITY